jgi:hypothetical protein
MIISHSRKFIFVHIHKAGGTSAEKALDPYLAWNDLIVGGSVYGERIQGPYKKRFGLSKHSAVSEIETVCGSSYLDEYFVFAMVRHPLARLCSLYNFVASTVNNWAVRHNIPLTEVLRHVTPQAIKKTPGLAWLSTRIFLKTNGFSEFIRHEQAGQIPGLRSQVSVLSRKSATQLAGAIFRLEDYPEWAGNLSERLQLEFRLPHANKSALHLIAPEVVSAADRLFVEDLFRDDYEAFGYCNHQSAR